MKEKTLKIYGKNIKRKTKQLKSNEMKAKKLSRVDELEKKLHTTIKMTEQLLRQNTFLRDLAIGTLETIKLMPDYDKAIEELKKQEADEIGKNASGEKKFEPLGETSN